jgi:hypothetical protein
MTHNNAAEMLGYELWHKKGNVHARLAHGTEAHCIAIAQMIHKDDWPDVYIVKPDGTDYPMA